MAKDNPFDPDLVRELANLIADTDLSEIEVEKGDLRIRVARMVTAAVTVRATRMRRSPFSTSISLRSVLAIRFASSRTRSGSKGLSLAMGLTS